MIPTTDLIRTLAGNLSPVRRLRPPLLRASLWLLLGVLVLGVLAISQGIRPDLVERLQDRAFVGMLGGAILTAIAAAISAFMLSLPDRSNWWVALPILPLVFWFSNVGYQCMTHWIALDPAGMSLGETARCFSTLVLASLPLSLALFHSLRYAVFMRPLLVSLVGSLAVAALTTAALFLFHVLDASVLTIMWNMGTALVIVGCSVLLTSRYAPRRSHGTFA